MNLTPGWIGFFSENRIESTHWSSVGRPDALDSELMEYAVKHGFAVFTHDLDFGTILAVTTARGPSVIQVRTQDPTPSAIGATVLSSLSEVQHHIERGALVTIEPSSMRVRILPLFHTAG